MVGTISLSYLGEPFSYREILSIRPGRHIGTPEGIGHWRFFGQKLIPKSVSKSTFFRLIDRA
jgi:hypothetical protein